MDPGIELLRQEYGLRNHIAMRLGISRSAVYMWKRIPLERVAEVSRITGIPRYKLRPDRPDIWPRRRS